MKIEKRTAVALIILAIAAVFMIKGSGIQDFGTGNSFVYLVYSPSCPHCHALINYLKGREEGLRVVTTTDGAWAARVLGKYGLNWNGGVPVLFAVSGSEITAIQGFPAGSQDKGGYFMGLEYEKALCESGSGTPVLNGSEYLYCRQADGFLLGNRFSVDYLINKCLQGNCIELK